MIIIMGPRMPLSLQPCHRGPSAIVGQMSRRPIQRGLWDLSSMAGRDTTASSFDGVGAILRGDPPPRPGYSTGVVRWCM